MFLEIQSIEMLFSKLKKNRTAPRRRTQSVKFQLTVDFLWESYESLKIRRRRAADAACSGRGGVFTQGRRPWAALLSLRGDGTAERCLLSVNNVLIDLLANALATTVSHNSYFSASKVFLRQSGGFTRGFFR